MIDAAIVRHIVSRFGRGGKGLLPERRGRTRAAAVKPLSSETSGTNLFLPFPQAIISGGLQGEQAAIADMLKFPEYIYLKAKGLPTEARLKLAGQLAAEILNRYPHLIQQLGATNDPIPAWAILRNVVMRQLEQSLASEAVTAEQVLS